MRWLLKHKSTTGVLNCTFRCFSHALLTEVPTKAGSNILGTGLCRPAHAVIPKSAKRNEYWWTALILKYNKCGQCGEALKVYQKMQQAGVKPSSYTYVALLKACSSLQDLETARKIHAEVTRRGLASDLYVGTMLICVYAKCKSLVDSRRFFEQMHHRTVVSWNAIILGYAHMNEGEEALHLYFRMQKEGVMPDERTFVSALKACSSLLESSGLGNEGYQLAARERILQIVKSIHEDVMKVKLQLDLFVGTMLVSAYAKSGSLKDARRVFEQLSCRDVISWTAMIFGYASMDKGEEALHFYTRMRREGVVPDSRTYVSVLKACSSLAESEKRNACDANALTERCLQAVKTVDADIRKHKIPVDVFVGTMLVDAYAKCGSLEDARSTFDTIGSRDVISWNAIILAYAQVNDGDEALRLFMQMQQEGVQPDDRTFVGALTACGSLGDLEKGKEIHLQILEASRGAIDCFVADSLISMYGKCGSMVDAQQVFDAIPRPALVAWNALIVGYAHEGASEIVFDLFSRMKEEAVNPDSITFLGVLTVCSQTGLVKMGQEYFDAMSKCGIIPSVKHFTCLVDLLGRSGQLDQAMEIVRGMPCQPDSALWECVLGACRKWQNLSLGRQAFKCAIRLNDHHTAAYILMADMYATAHMMEQAREIHDMRVNRQVWKGPGWTRCCDEGGAAHVFMVGEQAHAQKHSIYATIEDVFNKLKNEV